MSGPVCFVTALTGKGESLQVSLHMLLHIKGPSISNLPAVSTGIVAVLSPDNVLANLLGVGDGRINDDHHGLGELSRLSDHRFCFD